MATPLVPQEVFLLERYISIDYFVEMRDAWGAMISVAQQALDIFEKNLPDNYRKRPLYDQPGVVWNGRVLINFNNTLSSLDKAIFELNRGDLAALGWSSNVHADFVAFSRDYSSAWMQESAVVVEFPDANEKFWRLLGKASQMAFNVAATLRASWSPGSLSIRYSGARGELNSPAVWPVYALNRHVCVMTGALVPGNGIYLPDVDESVPVFMLQGRPAPDARVGYDVSRKRYASKVPACWTLVERVDKASGVAAGGINGAASRMQARCDAGEPCPRTGYWFTPAKVGSHRHFQAGEIMPSFESAYGLTIWQWDQNQNP